MRFAVINDAGVVSNVIDAPYEYGLTLNAIPIGDNDGVGVGCKFINNKFNIAVSPDEIIVVEQLSIKKNRILSIEELQAQMEIQEDALNFLIMRGVV